MELTTFGAVLKFALEQEAALAGLYAAAAEAGRELPAELAANGERNRKRLELIRRQQVNEMLLEAVQGLDTEDYRLDAGDAARLEAAEATLERFYREAAARLSLPEVVRSFGRLAEEHAQTRARLAQG